MSTLVSGSCGEEEYLRGYEGQQVQFLLTSDVAELVFALVALLPHLRIDSFLHLLRNRSHHAFKR